MGDVAHGVVSGVEEDGAFIQLDDGSLGMLHRSEISQELADLIEVEEVFPVGERIKVSWGWYAAWPGMHACTYGP